MHTRTYRLLILAAWIAVVGLTSLSFTTTTPAMSAPVVSPTTGPLSEGPAPAPWHLPTLR
ncbi:MAG: hypothetical protein WBC04_03835 [Candidatus Acidiferrales bacterium]